MAATGLPESKNSRTKPTASLVHPQLVGVDRAARQQQRVVVVDGGVGDEAVDREVSAASSRSLLRACDLAGVERQQLDLRAGVLDGLARLLEFDALDAVGGQDRDATVTQDIAHGSCSLFGDSAVCAVRRRPS